jgi:subtilisin family serine protease
MKRPRFAMIAGLALCMAMCITVTAHASLPVKVAILDSGCNIGYKEGISLIDGTVKDHNGHGTLMASIIKEVYPEAELYIIKVIGKDGLLINQEAVILGLEWAISRGVDVINMSLRLKDSERLHEAIRKAYQDGIVMVAASGNKTTRMGLLTSKMGLHLTEVAYPARYSEVMAVGALNRYGKIYDASITGQEVEIYCKGIKGRATGTSVASAYAAGFAAKIVSLHPHSQLQEIREIMHQESLRNELK